MNKLQKVASSISGFELNSSFRSARHDAYYEICSTIDQKIAHIVAYADYYLDIALSDEQALKISKSRDGNHV